MVKQKLQITRHALDQLEKRCHIEAHKHEIVTAEQTSERLYGTPNGFARLVSVRDTPAVLIIQNKTVVTAITLEMAFSDCPQAVFFALIARGEINKAIILRIMLKKGQLPKPSDLPASHYKYSRQKAGVLWLAFNWIEIQHS